MASKMINKFLNADLEGKEKKYNNIKLLEILIAIVFIVFGIILILNKTVSDKFISTFLGILILVEATLNIYSAVMSDSNKIFKINILFGLIFILIAIFLFVNPIKFVNYITIYYGTYLIINGIKEFINSIKYKLIKEDSWLIILIMSILTASLGVLMIFYPFESFGIIEIVGIFSILFGLLTINTSNLLRNRVEKFMSKLDN